MMHGSSGALRGRAVLLLGRPGAGKSDLLLRLVDRGFMLVADDQVIIEAGQVSPPAALAGLIEIRGFGLLRMSHVAPVPLVLVVTLDGDVDQESIAGHPPEHGTVRLPVPCRHAGLGLPMLRIDPFRVSAPLQVEIALDCLAGRRSLLSGGLDLSQ
ncbi:MAG: HPr kinase/phosphorylase [Janthinobacterium lividum]